jgi:hypothetical protein
MPRLGVLVLAALIVAGLVLPERPALPAANVTTEVMERVAPAAQALSRGDRPQTSRADGREPRSDTNRQREKGRSTRAEAPCDGLDMVTQAGRALCTHGPDPAPTGFNVSRRVQPLSQPAARRASAPIICDGDGQSGFRVQVLYVHASDTRNRYSELMPSLQAWAGAADRVFHASAAETGGRRNLRFVHDAGCQPIVAEVEVSASGDSTFGTTIREVITRGHDRTDRIYLMFVDTTSAGICGVATMSNDDRPSEANWHNDGPSYARVDAGCWSGSVAAHELMHNLGGVQDSAPHASGAGHCVDEYDVMCYRDSGQAPALQIACADRTRNTTRFDCDHDDYFHTNPAPGSYLANHWNPANNRFLIARGDGPVGVKPDPGGTDTKDKKKKKRHKKKQGKGARSRRSNGRSFAMRRMR